MKYLLLSLLLLTQLFAYETNKPITVYGSVSKQIIHSSLTNKKENHYILNTYHIDDKGIKDTPFQLLFDSNKTNITIPMDQLSQQYKLKGIIVKGAYQHIKHIPLDIFKVSSIEKRYGKIKVANFLNIGKVKFMLGSPMLGKVEAEEKKLDIDYISNVKIKADDKLLYNVNISPCISKNPLLKFSYKDTRPISLTLEYTDNNGKIRTNSKKVNHRNSVQKTPQILKLSANPRTYPTNIKSIKNLFGNITLIEDGIQLRVPKIAENGGSIPIYIRSSIEFKSITLFIRVNAANPNYPSSSNCIENDKFNLISQWFSTPYSIVDFSIRIKMRQSGEVLAVLEAKNGKFYTARKKVHISIGGGN